jgi:hypothetical protein
MKILNLLVLCSLLSGCNRSGSGSASDNRFDIPLSTVSDGACLNIEKYVSSVRALSSGQQPTYMTTHLRADGSISRNFLLRLVYGNFAFTQTHFSQIQELANIRQNDCQTVHMETLSGDMEEFTVKDAKENFIRFENASGESYSYEWISSKRIKVSVKYITGDYLCNPNGKITVKIDKEYNWENNFFESPTLEASAISSELISLMSEATNSSTEGIYSADRKTILTPALKNLVTLPIRPGVENCL